MAIYSIKMLSPSTELDSIKISGAVTYAYSMMFPDLFDDFISNLKSGKIAFSGVFPYDSKMYYPFPFINNIIINSNKEAIKKRKQVPKYIDEEELRNIIGTYSEKFEGVPYREYEGFHNEFIQNVTVPGISLFSEPEMDSNGKYKSNDIFIKELYSYGDGYFIANGSDKRIDSAIKLLADLGISGRAGTGNGHAKIEKISNEDMGQSGNGLYLLLSCFIPNKNSLENIDFKKSRYNFASFNGKNTHGVPLGPYRYFAPGSILYLKDEVRGINPDIGNRIISFNPVLKKV
jgi:CRISPR-associated protein Csm4